MKTLYTAHVTTIGARNGTAKSDDGVLDLVLASPGSNKAGATNPEQLFAAGYSACFGGAYEAMAKKQGLDASGTKVAAHVSLIQEDEGGYRIGVVLEVSPANLSPEDAQKVLELAHAFCPYSKATRGNIDVDVKLAA